uniref:Proheparin-binding EGF-like growth factor n=1 Tax=Scophthalmus maximus TaxID=52904 RepID=A0A8D3CSH5_SCOMX
LSIFLFCCNRGWILTVFVGPAGADPPTAWPRATQRVSSTSETRCGCGFLLIVPGYSGANGVISLILEAEEEDEYYYEDEYEDGLSGDYEMELPRGKALTSSILPFLKFLSTAAIPFYVRRGKGRKKAKGKGKKRNPCLRKYKDFCIHGTCQYLRNIRAPSCVCLPNYSGERCQFITLPVQSPEGYNRTTALAVVAVVLSSVCLTIIGLLLMLRFYKRGAYDVENEEKVKLGLAPNH